MKRDFSHARVLLPWTVVLILCSAAIQLSVAWAPQPAIQVLNSALPSGVNGSAYQAKLYASGGAGPYTWALLPGSVLPTGTLFQFSAGGVLSGTPTTTGSYSIVVQATDANGRQGSRSYTLTISNSGITTTSLPSGVKGIAYNATLAATGGAAPYSWTIVPGQPGKLPSGLSMTSSGVISGTPGMVGYQEFMVRATDSRGQRFSQTLGINTVMPLTVSGSSLPMGTIGRSYKSALGASGGQAPYTWKLVAGAPPSIIGVDTTGTVSGTPTVTGSYGFTVQASDASGQQVQTPASIAITGLLAITTTSLPSGKVGALYSANVAANGGLAPYSWNLTGGMLPPGLTLTTLGGISGTPATAGPFSFTLQVADSGGGTSSQTYTVSIAAATAPVVITTTSLPNGTAGTAYSSSVSATGGTSPYTWAVSAGALPAGLVLSSGGGISGTPSAAGSSTFALKVTDSSGGTSSQTYTVSIAPGLVIMTTSLPSGYVGNAYSATLAASGGTTPYTWSILSGLIPPGTSLTTTTGTISGTPTSSGTYAVTVQVTDAVGHQISANLSIVVAAPLTITSASLPGGTGGVAYSATLTATGGTSPYSWSVTSGTLPAGVTLSTAGALSGTPTNAGAYSFGIRVVDSIGATASQSYNLTITHSVSLNWTASTSTNVIGYNVYRATQAGDPYTLLTSPPVAQTTYTDTAVQAGQTYYYVATAVDNNNNESPYSNQAQAVVPSP